MSYLNTSNLGFRNQKSADGRLRISTQISLGDYKQFVADPSSKYDEQLIGSAASTYTIATGGHVMTTAANNDAAIRQTLQWHNYYAGKPQKIELTASGFNTQANIVKRFGYFSSNTTTPFASNFDGMYFENDGTTLRCKIMNNGTEVFNKPYSEWLNQSELASFDPADFNFYVIDFLYLGGAVCNFWILTSHGLTLIASYQHINVSATTFVRSPNQPIRYEIRQTGAGSGTFNNLCVDVAVEGVTNDIGGNRSYDTGHASGLTGMSVGSRYAILAIRQQAAYRNIIIKLKDFIINATSDDDMLINIFIGGATVGTPTWVSIADTPVEGFLGSSLTIANAVHSGGRKIYSGYVKGSSGIVKVIEEGRNIGSLINGTREALYLTATPVTANGAVLGSINWLQLI
jgi:hypothetical protein